MPSCKRSENQSRRSIPSVSVTSRQGDRETPGCGGPRSGAVAPRSTRYQAVKAKVGEGHGCPKSSKGDRTLFWGSVNLRRRGELRDARASEPDQ